MPTTTKRRPVPADRCPVCNAQNGEPCRNSINNKPRDRPPRHPTRFRAPDSAVGGLT